MSTIRTEPAGRPMMISAVCVPPLWRELCAVWPALEAVDVVVHVERKRADGKRWRKHGWVPHGEPRVVHIANTGQDAVGVRRTLAHEATHALFGAGHTRRFWRAYVDLLWDLEWITLEQRHTLRARIAEDRGVQVLSGKMMRETLQEAG